jgi:arginine decarboxylase
VALFSVREAEELYQVPGWGDGYFRINSDGNLAVRPTGRKGPEVDLFEVMARLQEEDLDTPIVLRFPQILRHRVDRLNRAFDKALRDNNCKGVRYRGVFPIKVNQRREVVQELAKAGRRWQYGLEVGSKAELVAALTMDPSRKSLLVVNGFKDRPFLEAACDATAFKDEVVIVLDEVGELPHLIPLMAASERPPILGLRLKLRSKAPGKWSLSGGEKAKFGLTIPEVLWAVEELQKAGQLDRLQMLHFHIGSQISHIRRIGEAAREAARMHVELVKMGAPLRLIDLGGGLAVDYDGSASSAPTSCNYTMEEYASTVVAIMKDACDDAEVPMPDLISESGRSVVSHHAVFVTNVIRRIPYLALAPDTDGPREEDPTPLWNLYELHNDLTHKNVYESFHDAVQIRDDLYTLFDLGHLRLEAMGRGERLLRAVFAKIKTVLEEEEDTESEEYTQTRALLGQKLVCNFSLFQSLPDVWGVKQQFPILPLHRLDQEPKEVATLADITCDSDGEIRHFADAMGTRNELPVHSLSPGKPYYLAMCLVGAYQDALGDYHNLFGETNEAFIDVNEDGTWSLGRITAGSQVADMLEWVRYDPKDLKRRIRRRVERLRQNGRLGAEEARALAARYVALIDSSTYLESRR